MKRVRRRRPVSSAAKAMSSATVAARTSRHTGGEAKGSLENWMKMAEEHPEQNRGSTYELRSLRDTLVGQTKQPLLLLLAGVGFVLLIACANVGNLLLARSLSRQQEFAMRLALGASRRRLAMEMLTESLVLSLAGGVVGMITMCVGGGMGGSGIIEAQFMTVRQDGRKSSHVARFRWNGRGFTQSADN